MALLLWRMFRLPLAINALLFTLWVGVEWVAR